MLRPNLLFTFVLIATSACTTRNPPQINQKPPSSAIKPPVKPEAKKADETKPQPLVEPASTKDLGKEWADKNVRGIQDLSEGQRQPIYKIINIFYERIMNWKKYKPFYDELYKNPKIAKDVPYFINLEDGLFFAVLTNGKKITDLPGYDSLKGKTVEQIFGEDYKGDTRLMDDVPGEGTRQTAIVLASDLTDKMNNTYNTFYHEFGHVLFLSLMTGEEYGKVEAMYKAARERKVFLNNYAATNSSEYFADGLEAFLTETKPNPEAEYRNGTRQKLQEIDPDLYSFIATLVSNK